MTTAAGTYPTPVEGYTHAVETVPVIWAPTDKLTPVPAKLVVWPNERYPGEFTVHVEPEGWASLWYCGRDGLGPFGRWSAYPTDAIMGGSFQEVETAVAAALGTPQIVEAARA